MNERRPVTTRGRSRSLAIECLVVLQEARLALISRFVDYRRRVSAVLAAIATLIAIAPPDVAGNELAGKWTLRITIPEAPNSQTFFVTLDVGARGESLHRRVTITDESGRRVCGVWRQVGKQVSIANELPCPGDVPCASLIMLGRVKGGGILMKRGEVIVMWNTENSGNPALYDTSNGSFLGNCSLFLHR
jgi:hypothetical protein